MTISRGEAGRPGARLIHRVYRDGVDGLDPGDSSTQSVTLRLIVTALTVP